ncbi:HlyD family efflux transporter periplasmic adaptor subunit [Ancylomarina euxinus]|uniref:HlyD family efflux transporter periplasmic adaptor subunit n=1 Tax=Ancylomarina euxinus TaxID=2283627 RepID=A0A425Y1W4_9BACT|nr:HlyD family efflux transporter periplasmic adaptor subunit [Ancylomarina euxinus]MCZ4695045.1 HlyD family efflux transporter periplasmic adaptor subunit [Ancylomarina euxinus]MUP15019.1 HlyD family efflux transporter periplasmic adaptor subunit [Ancylomarina euxinus]RRG21907.1 HlyD family efflux transporter periplasmic adaptor subunit [Ancylomarina euxinus]
MKLQTIIGLSLALAFLTSACNQNGEESDAYGNFEATEYLISAENSGKILALNLDEGDVFDQAKQVGLIDTTQLFLQKEQLKAQKQAIASGVKNILSRIAVYQEQIAILKKDKLRIDKMFADGAATSKEVDDINGKIQLAQKQIQAVRTENAKVLGELENVDRKIEALSDLIGKSVIYIPKSATVLEKYHEEYEMVNVGTPLFKLADLNTLDLRVYISGDQLSEVKIGQEVKVLIDKNKEENQTLTGKVIWISSQSEFTPKIIQTKKERVKLVYALKVKVKNDGRLKIGMPGEIRFK